jgi:hypothetical protein
MADQPWKIEVIGNAKTGTTGIFNSIRAPLLEKHPDTLLMFEPRSSALYRLTRHPVPFAVLVKAMINKNGVKIAYDAFTHHVLITRDPRDTLVSQLLYLPLGPQGVRAGPKKLERLLDALRAKEADPAGRPFKDLYETAVELTDTGSSWDKLLDRFRVAEQLAAKYDCFVLRYEDFTDNRLDALSAYLGLDVQPLKPKRVEELNAHVIRSATYGDWQHWFTPNDVEFFRPLLTPYMDAFGYDDDWTLAPSPLIPRETASGYVESRRPVVEKKMERRFERPAAWDQQSVTTREQVEEIEAIANDSGAGVYGCRYALLLLEGRVVPRDDARAFDYAYRSALVGHLPAMELVARMFREGIGTEPDAQRAEVWDHEADVLRAPPPEPGQPRGKGGHSARGATSGTPRPQSVPSRPRGVVPTLRWVGRRLRRAAGQRRRLGRRTHA